MGGTLLLEAVGVTLSPGSTGILAGFFIGSETLSRMHCRISGDCAAGNRSGNFATDHSGNAGGDTYAMNPANQYTLRVRVHCPEYERELAVYRSFGDSGPITAGGQWNLAPGKIQWRFRSLSTEWRHAGDAV